MPATEIALGPPAIESWCTMMSLFTVPAAPAFARLAFTSSESSPFGMRRSAALAA